MPKLWWLALGTLLAGAYLTDDAPAPPVTNPAWQWEKLPWEGKAPHRLWAAPWNDEFIVVVSDLQSQETAVLTGTTSGWRTDSYPGAESETRTVAVDGDRGVVHALIPHGDMPEIEERYVSLDSEGWSLPEALPSNWISGVLDLAVNPETGELVALVQTGRAGGDLPRWARKATATALASKVYGGWVENTLSLAGETVILTHGELAFQANGDLLLGGTLVDGRPVFGRVVDSRTLALEVVPLPTNCRGLGISEPVSRATDGTLYFVYAAHCRGVGHEEDASSQLMAMTEMRGTLVHFSTNYSTLFLYSREEGADWAIEKLSGLTTEGPRRLLLDGSGQVHFLRVWWDHSDTRDGGPKVLHGWQDKQGDALEAPLGVGGRNVYSPSFHLLLDSAGIMHAWFLSETYSSEGEVTAGSIVHAWLPAGASDTNQDSRQ